MSQPTTIYYFHYRCERSCSFWLQADSVDGDVTHWPATCPYDHTPLVEVD